MVAEREIRIIITNESAREAFACVQQERDRILDLMIGSPAHPPSRQRDVVYLNTAFKLLFDFLSFKVLHQDSPDPQERRHLLGVMANQPELVELYRRLICREIRSGVKLVEILNRWAIQRANEKSGIAKKFAMVST